MAPRSRHTPGINEWAFTPPQQMLQEIALRSERADKTGTKQVTSKTESRVNAKRHALAPFSNYTKMILNWCNCVKTFCQALT